MKPIDSFPTLLHAFFYEWMVQQRMPPLTPCVPTVTLGACFLDSSPTAVNVPSLSSCWLTSLPPT